MQSSDWLNLERGEFMTRWYREQYEGNAYRGAAGRLQAHMHRSLERGYTSTAHFGQVLEVGGNIGEHIPFVKHSRERYVLSDLSDCRETELSMLHAHEGVEFECADVTNLQWPDGTFDRVINTCLLHHVNDPELALSEIRRVLRIGGVADVFISGDPGMAFRAARYLGPIRSARAKGLEEVKRLVDARDHRNHVGSLLKLTSQMFRGDRAVHRSYPLDLPGWNTSLWHTFRIVKRA